LSKELFDKSVEELAPLLENKSLSPVELTSAILDHAEETQETLNAYMAFYREEAEEAAKKAESEISNGNYRGMYHGIPIALKDNLYFKNKVTTMSSKIHKGLCFRLRRNCSRKNERCRCCIYWKTKYA